MSIKRLLTSFSVAAIISCIIFLVLNDYGITWDEPIHMRNGDGYVAWLKHPVFSEKDNFFKVTTDDVHPPLRKLLASITHDILTSNLRIVDNTRGYRISAILFVFPFMLLLAYITIGQFGYFVGMLIPFLFSLLPHVLFLTPLVTMDYAISALWFIAVITFIKGMKNYASLTISGICIGCTLLTKLHGFLLFIPIGVYWIWYWHRSLHGKHLAQVRHAVILLLYCIVLALGVYIVGWPWLWTSPMAHLGEYFRIQFAHGTIPVYIFGHTYAYAPWWYAPVMFLSTTPMFVLGAFFIGAIWALRSKSTWDRIILLNALYPIIFFSLPGVYRYDWVRLFLSAYPFVCLVAGRGIFVSIKFFDRRIRPLVGLAILCIWLFTVFSSVIRIHPWESSYYNELVGGILGAHRLGFESEFYGNAYVGVLPWMNANKKDMMCVSFTKNVMDYYQAMGQIEPGVVYGATGDACKYEIILMRQGLFIRDVSLAQITKTQKPVYTVSVDGVTLVGVYDITKIQK